MNKTLIVSWLFFVLNLTSSIIFIEFTQLYCYSIDNFFLIKIMFLVYLLGIALGVYTCSKLFIIDKVKLINKIIFCNEISIVLFSIAFSVANFVISFLIINYINDKCFDFFSKGYNLSFVFGLKEGFVLPFFFIENGYIQVKDLKKHIYLFSLTYLLLFCAISYYLFYVIFELM